MQCLKLQTEYFLAKIGSDAAENGSPKSLLRIQGSTPGCYVLYKETARERPHEACENISKNIFVRFCISNISVVSGIDLKLQHKNGICPNLTAFAEFGLFEF